VLLKDGADTDEVNRPGARGVPLLVALVLATLGVWSNPAPAFACDCTQTTTTRALRQADAVFRGTVLSTDEVGRGAEARTDIRFRVDAVYKGTAYAEQVVATPREDPTCGLPAVVGGTWVVFALDGIEGRGDDAVHRLITSACSGNLASGVAPAALGRARSPLPGQSDREEQSTNADRALTRGLVGVGVAALVLVAAAGVGLALVWRSRPSPRR